jgi:hypothetical protein
MIRRKPKTEAPCPSGNGDGDCMKGFAECEAEAEATETASHSHSASQKQKQKQKLKEWLSKQPLKKSLGKYEEGRKILEAGVKLEELVDICIDEMGICFGGWESRDSICQRCGVREICKISPKERESN